jgi:hypothetical protein
MTIKVTQWSPDTCGCIFEYEWDDALTSGRVHNLTRVIRRGPESAHALIGDAPLFARIVEENGRKNITAGLADSIRSGVSVEGFSWSFDSSRILTVTITGLTNTQKNNLQSLCDSRFGSGNVIVV